ncbi:MAG TPA: glycosyltransferase [Saprospirales bacterium]|nr:glycosyltransferase [Saprospirales bacterium]
MSASHAYVAVTNDLNQDQRMHRICNTIHRAGFQVTLIGRRKSNSDSLYDHSFAQHRLSMFFQSGVLFYLEYQIRLFFYLLFRSKPAIMYSVDLDTALPVMLASVLRGSKTIHDAHELFTEVPELLKSPFKRWIWQNIGKMTMKGFDYRITVNNSLAMILGDTYRCAFIPIRNLPIVKELSTVKLEFQRPYIWYQGVLNQGRGLEEMITAMTFLPNFDLRIAGEGDRSLTLRHLAEKSKAKDRIHFHGWMHPSDMHSWASNAWLGINLLDGSAGNYYYSLANRTFDYVQAELPALHMDFPEYRTVIEQYGVGELLTDLNSDCIVCTIQNLMADTFKYNQYRNACKKAKEELTWKYESEKIMDVLNTL